MVARLVVVALLVAAVWFFNVPSWFMGTTRPNATPPTTVSGTAADRVGAAIGSGDPDAVTSAESGSSAHLGNQLEDDARRVFNARQTDDAKMRADAATARALAEQLAAVQRDSAAQLAESSAQLRLVQKRLEIEQARSASLDHDMAGAREQMAQTARDGNARDDTFQPLDATGSDDGAKLREAQYRVTALTDQLAGAQRDAAARVVDLRQRLENEQAHSASLEAELAAKRQQPTQPVRDQAAAGEPSPSTEASRADDAAKLREAQARVDALAGQLADAQRGAAAQTEESRTRLQAEQSRSADLERDLAARREQLTQSVRDEAAAVEARRTLEAAAKDGNSKLAEAQARADALAGKLADAQRGAGTQVAGLQKQLEGEQAKSAGLERDLATGRDQLTRAARDEAAAIEARRTFEAAAKDGEGKLAEAQARADALAGRLADAQRGSGEQVVDLRKRLEGEQAKSAGLERDLAAGRDRLTQAVRDEAAAVEARRVSEAAAKDGEGKRAEAQARADALANKLADAQRGSVEQVADLRKRLEGEQAKSAGLERDLAGDRDRLAQAARDGIAAGDGRRLLESAAKDGEAKLRDAQAQVAALAGKLTEAQRGSDAQVVDLRSQLDGERSKSATLARDLAAGRDRLAQDARDAAAAAEARRSLEVVAERADAGLRDAQAQAAALAGKLAEAQRGSDTQVVDLRKQLEGEQSKSAGVDRDLAAARERVAQAARDATGAAEARRSLEAVLADRESKLKEARDGQSALSVKIAEAGRVATAQADDLQKRLAVEQGRSTGFERDLKAARDQMAEVARDAAAAADARRSSDALAGDVAAKLEGERKKAAALAEAVRVADQRVADLQKRFDGEQARSAGLDRDLAGARDQLAQAGRDATAAIEARRASDAAVKGGEAKLRDLQDRAASFAAGLAGLQRDAAAKVEDLRKRLDAERTRSAGLERDLASAREQVAQAMLAGTEQAGRSSDPSKAGDARLKEEQDRAVALADRLVTAQSDAAARVDDLQGQLQIQRDRASGLERSLVDARQQMARVLRDRASAQASKDGAPVRLNEQGGASPVPDARASAPPVPVAGAGTQAGSIATASGPAPRPEATGGRAEPDGRPADARRAEVPTPAQATSGTIDLPTGVPPRVILRYARDNDSARARATALRLTLQAQGLDVADPIGASTGVGTTSVTYFYGEDQDSASRIANTLDSSRLLRSRPTRGATLPRPGTIEVAIAG